MKRTLIALALTGLTLGANVALADWNDFSIDPYWKRANETTSVAAAEGAQDSTQSRKYEQVDGYNP
jgi:hypothetical protein